MEVRPQPAHQGRASGAAPAQDAARHEAHGVRALRRVRRHGPSRPAARPARSASSTCYTGTSARIPLPTTCWHLVCHPVLDVVLRDLLPGAARRRPRLAGVGHGLAPREYAFEIDAETGQVLQALVGRTATCRRTSTPTSRISDTRADLLHRRQPHRRAHRPGRRCPQHRIIDEHPGPGGSGRYGRQSARRWSRASARGQRLHQRRICIARRLQVSRGTLVDGIYACQLSADQSLLFTANRGQNHITVYDYPSLSCGMRVPMPELQEFDPAPRRVGRPPTGVPPLLPDQPDTST